MLSACELAFPLFLAAATIVRKIELKSISFDSLNVSGVSLSVVCMNIFDCYRQNLLGDFVAPANAFLCHHLSAL